MIIIGHPLIKYNPFYKIKSAKDIQSTPPNSTVLVKFADMVELSSFLNTNKIVFGVIVSNDKELVLAQNMGASFLVSTSEKLALKGQKIADNYMYDAKILLLCDDENDFEFAIENLIDGVIFKEAINATILK